MKIRTIEVLAVVGTIVGVGLALLLPFSYESYLISKGRPDAQIITLTAVAMTGIWTEQALDGTNYWNTDFQPANPVFRVGKPAVIRLKSADVTHTFYVPSLEIGPIEVYPGHVVEIEVPTAEEGVFDYYCTTVCGEPHFGMRGKIVVQGNADTIEEYWLQTEPPESASLLERGDWLFHQSGCSNCHGGEAQGGIPNWNYINDTVPQLNFMAEKLMLFDPEDVEAILRVIESGTPFEQLQEPPPIPRFNVFLAQYQSVRDVIRKGNPPGKKDTSHANPPLEMLAWGQRLSESDIDAIIVYLLSLQPWEE